MAKKTEKKKDRIFDWVDNLYNKKHGFPPKEEITPMIWQINNFLSMDKDLLEYVAYYQKYMFTLKDRYYLLWYALIPKCLKSRNPYYKVKREKDSELLERLCSVFGLSKVEVVDYLKILRKTYDDKELYEFLGMEKK